MLTLSGRYQTTATQIYQIMICLWSFSILTTNIILPIERKMNIINFNLAMFVVKVNNSLLLMFFHFDLKE